MTNLDLLRNLPAERMVEFLVDLCMTGTKVILDQRGQSDKADEIRAEIKVKIMNWLFKECEL